VRHRLFSADELQPGEWRTVVVDGASIVVIKTPDGGFRALRDICPHQGVPLSLGKLQPIVVGDDVGVYDLAPDRFMLRCPWHGYEFDVDSGRCLADPEHVRVRTYPVTIEEGSVCIER
jgi:nitrite reductase/ring-hydroxylating ferredoxin subunit